MESVVLALASNERYFSGLYCAIASALSHMARGRTVDVRVLDGGISQTSRNFLSQSLRRFGQSVRLEFVPMDVSIFRDATLGPGGSHMAYCRILLPRVLDVPRLIYLDCDVLVFRDLSELFDVELLPGKLIAAVPDYETLSLADDSLVVAKAMKVSPEGAYFNSGVMLMNLDGLRKEHFFQRALEFLGNPQADYRFHDQSAINFLLHGQIDKLPEYWNRASWRFDAQQNNDLNCVLHYTTSAPWLGGTAGPAQVLFERFATEAGLPVNRRSLPFRRSVRRRFWRNGLAPLRGVAFLLASLLYRVAGREDRSAAYEKVARYWFDYIRNAPRRRRLYQKRAAEIQLMTFKFAGFESAR
jgi:lipopolysaccharide biosynthesis glycosyltransferase